MREYILKMRPRVAGHATFWEAVHHSENLPVQELARETSERIAGKVITKGCWQEDRAALLLDDDCGLEFWTEQWSVPWQLVDRPQFDAYLASWASDGEVIRVRCQCVDGQWLASNMDRTAILSGIIGRRARRIVVDEFGTYLQFQRDRRYLSLHAEIIEGSERQFLKWFEDED